MHNPTAPRLQIGNVPIDAVTLGGALDAIDALVQAGDGGTIFTPNVDHIVIAQQNARFAAAYASSSLSLVDGMPVLWASRLLGRPLPEKLSGADLVLPLMQRALERRYRVFLLGGAPGVADGARVALQRDFPGLAIVGVDASRVDVDQISTDLVARIKAAQPNLVLVALGAPKQEIFSSEQSEALAPAVLLGIGASLDFVAGVRNRAPAWISGLGVEWLFRLVQEPRRLARRYLLRDPRFLLIMARQLWGGKMPTGSSR